MNPEMSPEVAAEVTAEVLVVGAGPAGLAAAAAARSLGREVVVVDENPGPGGQIWRRSVGAKAGRETSALLERARGTTWLHGLSIFDACRSEAGLRLTALDPEGGATVLCSERVILATGATELFLPFPGWTLPGVFGVGGIQALVKGGMDVSGRRIAVAGSGPLLLAVAASLDAAGAEVVGLFEQAPRGAVLRFGAGLVAHPRKLVQAVRLLGGLRHIPRHHSAWPVRAEGEGKLERVVFEVAGSRTTLEVDHLACAFGLVPATGLASLLGCELRDGRVVVDGRQRTTVEGVWCAGESTGIGGVDLSLVEGEVAGLAAGGDSAAATAAAVRLRPEKAFARSLRSAFALRSELRELPGSDTIVCRCEDVPWSQARAHRDARQAKLETRAGMGACQGRVCGASLEFLCGWERERPRPPLIPVPFSALADLSPSPSLPDPD